MINQRKTTIKLKVKSGQAIAELAIFGVLILIGFNVLLSYGQRFDERQKTKMEAFRRVLYQAYRNNAAVNYTLKKDSRQVDLFSGYGQGTPSGSSAGVSLMWQKGIGGDQEEQEDKGPGYGANLAFYQVNEQNNKMPLRDKEVENDKGDTSIVWSPANVWKEEIKKTAIYNAAVTRKENNEKIVNQKDSKFSENIDTTLYLRYDTTKKSGLNTKRTYQYNFPEKQINQGAYDDDTGRISYSQDYRDNVITKQRTWETDK
jgi:hypothetical protein